MNFVDEARQPDPALAKIQKPKPIMPIEIRYAIARFMMRM
jgi:hypothetical protein